MRWRWIRRGKGKRWKSSDPRVGGAVFAGDLGTHGVDGGFHSLAAAAVAGAGVLSWGALAGGGTMPLAGAQGGYEAVGGDAEAED